MSGIRAVLRVFIAFIAAGLILSAVPAKAETLPKEERAALQSLVQKQIEAFQRDDGAAAYGFATDRIHRIFPDVDTFMKMVRNSYPPVYRPRSVVFGDIVDTSQGPVQVVYLGGPDGHGYIAYYTFEKQPDGSWLISGCMLQKNPANAI